MCPGVQVLRLSLTPTVRSKEKETFRVHHSVNADSITRFFKYLTSLSQDAFVVCFGSLFGSAASFQLSAAGSLQHQVIRRQEILQRDSDGHH